MQHTWNLSVLIISALVILASMILSPTTDSVSMMGIRLPELCTFKRLTGMGCPGCGLTRSFTFMGHGELRQAMQMHVLGPMLYLGVVVQIPHRGWLLLAARRASATKASTAS